MRYALRSLFSTLISYSIIATLSGILDYGLSNSTLILVVLSVNLFISLILYDLKVFKWIVIIFGSTLLVIFSIMLVSNGRIDFPTSLTDYTTSLLNSIFYMTYITPEMFLPTTILFSFGISLLIYILINKFTAYITIYIVVSLIYAILIIGDYYLNYTYFQLFIFTAILMYFEKYYDMKFDKDKIKKKILVILPTFLIFALILTSASSISSNIKSDPVKFIDTFVDKIKEISINLGKGKSTDVVSYQTDTAYSQGYSSFNDTLVLIVDAPSNYHLRSQTYDYYDGENWSVSNDIRIQQSLISPNQTFISNDLAENILSLDYLTNNVKLSYDQLSQDDLIAIADTLFDKVDMYITYANIRTKALFIPINTYSIDFPEDKELNHDISTGALISSNTLEKSFSYTTKSFMPKRTSSSFSELLRRAGDVDPIFSLEDPDVYLQIPNTVPQRVLDLAFTITENYDNDYDKARAIEKYLSSNFEYSLGVEATPSDRDFVDYFLFDQPTGYCTYYASSMVILARSLGIPARFARGYVMPQKTPIEELLDTFGEFTGIYEFENDTIYQITENQSHAWPEIYIKGYGWMAFEPTAAYYSSYLPQDSPSDEYVVPERTPDKEVVDDISNKIDFSALLKVVSIIMAVILLLFPIVFFISKKIKYSKKSPREKIVQNLKKIIDLYGIAGYRMMSYDTARTYSEKIDQSFDFGKTSFQEIVAIFEKARYSDEKISVRELSAVEDYFTIAKSYLIHSVTFIRRFRLVFKNRL